MVWSSLHPCREWNSVPQSLAMNSDRKINLTMLELTLKLLTFLFLVFSNSFGEQNQTKLPKLEKISESRYRFGLITLDQKGRYIEFDATTNQTNGLIEYALVHESGKIHESLFRTKVRPQIIHACLLLLKHPTANGFFENLWSENPQNIKFDKSKVRVEVSWDVNGTQFRMPIETFAFNSKNQQSLEIGAFVFTGSKQIEVVYLAEASGSIIAVYADEEAVINSTDHDSNNDDVWLARREKMPLLEVPVTLRFLLPNI